MSPTDAPLIFGASEFTTWPWTFQQDVDHYQRLGVDSIEVCEFKLSGTNYTDQLDSAIEAGLKISSAQPSVRTLFPSLSQPEPQAIADRMARFRQTIDRFGSHAGGVPFVTNTGIPPKGNIQEVLDVATYEYARLADFAADYGAMIAVEPLNASIANVESAIWTLRQGLDLVERVGRRNFGICLDFWNIWQNADIEDTIGSCGEQIMVVQVSDWRTPRSFQDRLIPGDGDIPISSLLRAVRDSGFLGTYSVEIFSGDVPDSLWKQNLDVVIERSRAGMERAWAHATSA